MPAVSLLHLLHATTDIYKFHWAPSSESPRINVKSSFLTHFPQCLSSLHPQFPFPLWFSSLSSFLFIAPCPLTLIFAHTHTCKCTFYSHLRHFCCSAPSHPPTGSLKTSLSREEGKVLFCLISLLSPMWRKHG